MGGLTAVQQAVLDFYARYQAGNYLPPTIGEVADALRLSKSTVHHHVVELARRGELKTRSEPGRMTVYYRPERPAA